jgi:hypothetical protein
MSEDALPCREQGAAAKSAASPRKLLCTLSRAVSAETRTRPGLQCEDVLSCRWWDVARRHEALARTRVCPLFPSGMCRFQRGASAILPAASSGRRRCRRDPRTCRHRGMVRCRSTARRPRWPGKSRPGGATRGYAGTMPAGPRAEHGSGSRRPPRRPRLPASGAARPCPLVPSGRRGPGAGPGEAGRRRNQHRAPGTRGWPAPGLPVSQRRSRGQSPGRRAANRPASPATQPA